MVLLQNAALHTINPHIGHIVRLIFSKGPRVSVETSHYKHQGAIITCAVYVLPCTIVRRL